ncbi:rRNA maturation RNase YbeY [Singulisphaera sp. PoT]|uniref:rRNA maturation RNase YbeY n=1 Tax=Singulisphaera sp. PoT TaxID=3411797 RepID=UPI003BF51F6E
MDNKATTESAIEVEISDNQRFLDVDREALIGLVRRTLGHEKIEQASISLALVDDATIHEVNRRHLEHDWPTDVITFPLSDPDEPVLAGELVVSTEMAATTAKRAGVDPWAELALYVVHGLLHLCGYDDHSAEDREAMRSREDAILAGEGLTNTFPLIGLAETDTPGRESTRWPL